jgi:hypothetical protein
MGASADSEAELRARIAKLEAELARARRETEAWRTLFARTTRVVATFASELDELVQSVRSGQPLTRADEALGMEQPDAAN